MKCIIKPNKGVEYCRNQLASIAAYTFAPDTGLPIEFKENWYLHNKIMVEQKNEQFTLYRNRAYWNLARAQMAYYASIDFNNDEIIIEIKWQKIAAWFYIAWFIFALLLAFFDSNGSLSWIFLMVIAFIFQAIAKRRFRKFVTSFVSAL